MKSRFPRTLPTTVNTQTETTSDNDSFAYPLEPLYLKVDSITPLQTYNHSEMQHAVENTIEKLVPLLNGVWMNHHFPTGQPTTQLGQDWILNDRMRMELLDLTTQQEISLAAQSIGGRPEIYQLMPSSICEGQRRFYPYMTTYLVYFYTINRNLTHVLSKMCLVIYISPPSETHFTRTVDVSPGY